MNTIYAVSKDRKIHKVPYSYDEVFRSFPRKFLCHKLIDHISEIKPVTEKAAEKVENLISHPSKLQMLKK